MAQGDVTKVIEYDKIEVVSKWNIQVRKATIIMEEQADLDSDGNRQWTHTATDISGEDASVQAICNTAWTDSVKTEYKTWAEREINY